MLAQYLSGTSFQLQTLYCETGASVNTKLAGLSLDVYTAEVKSLCSISFVL